MGRRQWYSGFPPHHKVGYMPWYNSKWNQWKSFTAEKWSSSQTKSSWSHEMNLQWANRSKGRKKSFRKRMRLKMGVFFTDKRCMAVIFFEVGIAPSKRVTIRAWFGVWRGYLGFSDVWFTTSASAGRAEIATFYLHTNCRTSWSPYRLIGYRAAYLLQ